MRRFEQTLQARYHFVETRKGHPLRVPPVTLVVIDCRCGAALVADVLLCRELAVGRDENSETHDSTGGRPSSSAALRSATARSRDRRSSAINMTASLARSRSTMPSRIGPAIGGSVSGTGPEGRHTEAMRERPRLYPRAGKTGLSPEMLTLSAKQTISFSGSILPKPRCMNSCNSTPFCSSGPW